MPLLRRRNSSAGEKTCVPHKRVRRNTSGRRMRKIDIAISNEDVDIASLRRHLEKHAAYDLLCSCVNGQSTPCLAGGVGWGGRGLFQSPNSRKSICSAQRLKACRRRIEGALPFTTGFSEWDGASIWAHFARSRLERRPKSGCIRPAGCYPGGGWPVSRFGRDAN